MPANHRVLNELLNVFGPKLVRDSLITMSNIVFDNERPNFETVQVNLTLAECP